MNLFVFKSHSRDDRSILGAMKKDGLSLRNDTALATLAEAFNGRVLPKGKAKHFLTPSNAVCIVVPNGKADSLQRQIAYERHDLYVERGANSPAFAG